MIPGSGGKGRVPAAADRVGSGSYTGFPSADPGRSDARTRSRGWKTKVKRGADARLKVQTMLIITHRLQMVQHVRRVVRIDNGTHMGARRARGSAVEGTGAVGRRHRCRPDLNLGAL